MAPTLRAFATRHSPLAPHPLSIKLSYRFSALIWLVRQEPSGPPSFDVFPSARATLLDPGKPSATSPVTVTSVLGSAQRTASPLASSVFEAELLKQDAGPACGSCFSLDTLLNARSVRKNNRSTGCPCAEQSSGCGCWLDFAIHRFHFELRQLSLPNLGDFHPELTSLPEALPFASIPLPNSGERPMRVD